MELKEYQQIAKKFIDERDWRKFQTVKDLAMNASIESNELMDLFIWRDGKKMDKLLKSRAGQDLLEKVKNETADVFFSCLAIADHLNFDLGKAFLSKIDQLGKRYEKDKVKGKVVKIPENEWLKKH
ncbi:MAG: MazG-like family protein [Candidatus Acidifodinimicrobium sp.]